MRAHYRRISGARAVPTAPHIYGLRARLSHRGCEFMPDRFAEMRHGPRAKPAGRVGRRPARAAGRAGILLSGAMLAACSSSSDSSFSIFADPGKYQYYTCPQIAEAMKSQTQRVQDLKVLIDKAGQSVGGAAVGFIAYKADYVAAEEELASVHASARSKSCDQDATWRSSTAIR
jgi:hypothetical protein